MSERTAENKELQKIRVNIRCVDGSSALGYVNIEPGNKLIDLMNDPSKSFIVLREAEMYYEAREVASFKLVRRVAVMKKERMIMQKASIAWMEEI